MPNTLVKTIDMPGAGLGLLPFTVSAADAALAGLPSLGTCFNAGWLSGRGVKNLASLGAGALEPTGSNTVTTATMGASRPALAVQGSTPARLISPVPINPSEWTVFLALQFTSSGATASRDLLRAEGGYTTGYAPRIVLSQTGHITVFANTGSSVRLSPNAFGAPALTEGVPHFVAVTLSPEQGHAIWINGARLAHAPADTAPFDNGYQGGNWAWLRQNSGEGYLRVGWAGHCNVDLSRLSYSAGGTAGHMARLTAFMKAEYGIV